LKIGIIGPVATRDVSHLLNAKADQFPLGWAGAPFLAALITTLIARGHEVVALTLDSTLSQKLSEPIMASGPNFKLYYAPSRPRSFRFNGKYLGRMTDFFRRERQFYVDTLIKENPDVVHAHWSYEAAWAAHTSGLPYVVTCHDSPVRVLRFTPTLYRLGRYFMARKVLGMASVVTAVSGYLKNEVQKYCKVPVQIIPNPLSTVLVRAPKRGVISEAELRNPRIAVVLNGWSKFKNPEPAMEAFALLRTQLPGASLHLYGNDFGPNERAEIWAKEKNFEGGMVFHGMTPHDLLLDQLAEMHILLHPSLEESFGMALAEAMVLGLVVIGGKNSGGVPWVLDHGQAGILADVTSAKELAQVILDLVVDPKLYASLVERGLMRANLVFDPNVVTTAYEETYRFARLASCDSSVR